MFRAPQSYGSLEAEKASSCSKPFTVQCDDCPCIGFPYYIIQGNLASDKIRKNYIKEKRELDYENF